MKNKIKKQIKELKKVKDREESIKHSEEHLEILRISLIKKLDFDIKRLLSQLEGYEQGEKSKEKECVFEGCNNKFEVALGNNLTGDLKMCNKCSKLFDEHLEARRKHFINKAEEKIIEKIEKIIFIPDGNGDFYSFEQKQWEDIKKSIGDGE